MRTHHRKTGVDRAPFALVDLVDGGLHVVVDAPARHATQGREGTGMSIEKHLVALAGVSHQPERPAGTQLQVRYLHATINAANQQAFLAPVELERLAKCKAQRHEGPQTLALLPAPGADESSELAVATVIAFSSDLR
ncbi:hypothetical protein D9M70_595140 [compost metagenome]